MARTPAGLLVGPVIRLLIVAAVGFYLINYVDIGGYVDMAFYEIEQLAQSLLNPFSF